MAIAARLGTAAGSIAVSARYVCGTGIRGMATVPTRIPIADVGAQLPAEWSIVEGREAIARKFEFGDFKQAWEFMGKTAVLAEEINHHPEWFNVYNRVEVTLATHDCNGVSSNDLTMASKMNEFEAGSKTEA